MQYQSTRNKNLKAGSAQAILDGLAPDGGLYTMPSFDEARFDYREILNLDTFSMSARILAKLLPDFSEQEMASLVRAGYGGKFESDHLMPSVPVGEDFILELFRGPTSAFKDVALSMLPRLMTAAKEKCGVSDEILILTATSGDTGKAALAGFADAPGTAITVFYPEGKVSQVQELQMTTQAGSNVQVAAVEGNFDDAQSAVKRIFADKELAERLEAAGTVLSSANSINIGRLAPQVVYYYRAYADLVKMGRIHEGDKVDFVVPTGNFGNILSGFYAKRMGVPIGRLICASNENNVLTDFIKTGTYDRNRPFYQTASPSMDILISSNLERLLSLLSGSDEEVRGYMQKLSETGTYTVSDRVLRAVQAEFSCGFCTDAQGAQTIGKTFRESRYLLDTHTAVACTVLGAYRAETGDQTLTVVESTASPFKFTRSVMNAIDEKYDSMSDFELVDELSKIGKVKVPVAIEEIRNAETRHNTVCEVGKMKDTVRIFLGI